MGAENLRGIVLMLISMALFAVEDMFLKWVAMRIPAGEVLFVAGLASTLIFSTLALREGQSLFGRGLWHPAVIARNLGEMLGSITYIIALTLAPLATVSAILQAMPLVATMAAALFMGAAVGWRRWTAIVAGFIGVVLVIQPGAEGFNPASLLVVPTVAMLALRDLATRRVPESFSTTLVAAWGMMSIVLLGLTMMAWSWLVDGALPVVPDRPETFALLGAIVFGSAGYAAVVAAARTGEVSVVAPFRYARLLFAIIIGIVAFNEWPNALSLLGAAIIILSGLYSFARERTRARALPLTPASG